MQEKLEKYHAQLCAKDFFFVVSFDSPMHFFLISVLSFGKHQDPH